MIEGRWGIQHATIFGALDTVRPGGGQVLTAPYDPLRLLAQIERCTPELFAVYYLKRGPQAGRLQFVHRGLTAAAPPHR